MLCFWSIGMDLVASELWYKLTILRRNYRKMTILWSCSFNFFVKFLCKIIRGPQEDCVIFKSFYPPSHTHLSDKDWACCFWYVYLHDIVCVPATNFNIGRAFPTFLKSG